MAGEHDELGGVRYTAMYLGVVTDIADPEKLGRVRFRIAGLVEPQSGWAQPVALPGAGGGNRGVFAVPPRGALVGVWFHQGDVDHPFYACGPYGKPTAGSEVPGPVGGYRGTSDPDPSSISAEDAPKVHAWEGDRYVVFADERSGHERLVIRDKKTEDEIEFDGVKLGLTVKATTMLRLLCDGAIEIKGLAVLINGRPVAASSSPL